VGRRRARFLRRSDMLPPRAQPWFASTIAGMMIAGVVMLVLSVLVFVGHETWLLLWSLLLLLLLLLLFVRPGEKNGSGSGERDRTRWWWCGERRVRVRMIGGGGVGGRKVWLRRH
jgi:hypothetical protein